MNYSSVERKNGPSDWHVLVARVRHLDADHPAGAPVLIHGSARRVGKGSAGLSEHRREGVCLLVSAL